MVALLDGRWTVEESVNQGAALEQVGQRAQERPVSVGGVAGNPLRATPIGPISGSEGAALIRQDQQEVELTAPLCAAQDLKGLAFKWMPSADNGDLVRIVFEMGSVSWVPSIESVMIV
jgi:hypothetical protein